MYQVAQEAKKNKEHEALINEIKAITGEKDNALLKMIYENKEKDKEGSLAIRQEIQDMRQDMLAIKDGLLAIQGREFKSHCSDLLSNFYRITTEDFAAITKEHQVYNGLGGNHEGDALFDAVRTKYETGLKNDGPAIENKKAPEDYY